MGRVQEARRGRGRVDMQSPARPRVNTSSASDILAKPEEKTPGRRGTWLTKWGGTAPNRFSENLGKTPASYELGGVNMRLGEPGELRRSNETNRPEFKKKDRESRSNELGYRLLLIGEGGGGGKRKGDPRVDDEVCFPVGGGNCKRFHERRALSNAPS